MELIGQVIRFILSAAVAALKICFMLACLGMLMILFIVAREVAWVLRQENKKRMEEKEKNENSGV